jgi:hypothetical protein
VSVYTALYWPQRLGPAVEVYQCCVNRLTFP